MANRAEPVSGHGLLLTIPGHLARMKAAGIRRAITCGCEVPTLQSTVDLAVRFPDQLSAAIAIHPNDAPLHRGITEESPDGLTHGLDPWHREYSLEDAVSLVGDLARDNLVVAIGETGLDYFRTADECRPVQCEAFRAHIALAKELNLPMQIHDRDSHKEVIETLLADGAPERTVFHSYSGDAEMGEIARENGWYLSLSGTSSYKGNDGIRESARIVGLSHVMVETDAPYLSPMPYRGRTNAPYMIPYTLQSLANYLDKPLTEVAQATRKTTREVYGI